MNLSLVKMFNSEKILKNHESYLENVKFLVVISQRHTFYFFYLFYENVEKLEEEKIERETKSDSHRNAVECVRSFIHMFDNPLKLFNNLIILSLPSNILRKAGISTVCNGAPLSKT